MAGIEKRRSAGVRLAGIVTALWLAGAPTADGQATPAGDARPAPDFQVVTLGGEPYSRASLAGHPVLLVFWAPWCKVCQRELPLIGEFYEKDRPAPLRVLALAFADSLANVQEFVQARAGVFVFPTAYDEENRVAQDFRVTATPTFILLDAQGGLVLVHRGGGVLQNPRFREFLASVKG